MSDEIISAMDVDVNTQLGHSDNAACAMQRSTAMTAETDAPISRVSPVGERKPVNPVIVISDMDSGTHTPLSLDTSVLAAEHALVNTHAQYSAQYFGFTPKSLSDGMYNAVIDYTWESFQAAIGFIQQLGAGRESEESLQSAKAAILAHLTHAIDKAFDKLEVYVAHNICHVPRHVLLGEDAVQQGEASCADETQLDAEIARLEAAIRNEQYINKALNAEIGQADTVLGAYEEFHTYLDQLEQAFRSAGFHELQETKNVVHRIREMLATLPRPDIASTSHVL